MHIYQAGSPAETPGKARAGPGKRGEEPPEMWNNPGESPSFFAGMRLILCEAPKIPVFAKKT